MILGVGDREDLYSVWITLLPLSLGKTNTSLNRRFVARIYQFCFSVPDSSFVLFFYCENNTLAKKNVISTKRWVVSGKSPHLVL